MLTRCYDNFRSPAFDIFDTLGLWSDLQPAKSRTDSVDDEGIKIEMPGVKHEDLDISISGRTLRVVGKSRHGKEFSYVYALRSTVDESAIDAKLQDGLLEIRLPKKAETKARKIPIT